MNSNVASGPRDTARQKSVYVFEAPVRLWHWLHTFSFLTLAVTGYLIAHPLPSPIGEASDHFVMGNIRLIHFIAAYAFAIGFALRIYWAIVGNKYSREIFYLPIWKAEWWKGLLGSIKYYAFLTSDKDNSPGHNPLAQASMFFLNTLMTFFMIGTGFALYGQGLGDGSWADRGFGWIIPMLGGGESVRNWHFMGMWIILTFAIFHMYLAVRADIMGRKSSVSVIIGGWRLYRDDDS
jgi:Ni/Fe-hydrogenase 1 B-type cytochrome subunit